MIEVFLNEALTRLVKEAVRDFRLPKPPRTDKRRPGSLYDKSDPAQFKEPDALSAITVYDGWLPPKDDDDVFPFVSVRPVSGSVVSGRSSYVVEITIGTFGRDEQAYKYCLNVMRRILNALALLEDGILEKKYIRTGELSWELPFDQKQPYYEAFITTKWETYSTEFKYEV